MYEMQIIERFHGKPIIIKFYNVNEGRFVENGTLLKVHE